MRLLRKQHLRSYAADWYKPTMTDFSNLDAATKLLVERDFLGLVWVDRDLVAISKAGQLADAVPIEKSICKSVIVLANLEDDILALRDDPQNNSMELANVGVPSDDGHMERLNYVLTWSQDRLHLLLMIAKPIAARHLMNQ